MTSLVDEKGWRPAWHWVAGSVFLIGVLVAFSIRNPEGDSDPEGEGEGDGSREMGLTLGRALRSPAFWALTVGIGIYYFAFTGDHSVQRVIGGFVRV